MKHCPKPFYLIALFIVSFIGATFLSPVFAQNKLDSDLDGILDSWEKKHALNHLNPSDAALDTDSDGLSNLLEFVYGTNPNDPDTDFGGLQDGAEVYALKNPTNFKDDQWTEEQVTEFHTQSGTQYDTDGDKISNDVEKKYGTDPIQIDTDKDGLSDFDELFRFFTNPHKSDTDYDNLTDIQEIFTYESNPVLRDTDYDGLLDESEINEHKTSPTNPDTDGGSINDGDEILLNKTNPQNSFDDNKFLVDFFVGNIKYTDFINDNTAKIETYKEISPSIYLEKPSNIEKIVLNFTGEDIELREDENLIKLTTPKNQGLYELKVSFYPYEGNVVEITRLIQINTSGKVLSKAEGNFRNLTNKIIKAEGVEKAKVTSFVQADEELNKDQETYTDNMGNYTLLLSPGTYKIHVDKEGYKKLEKDFTTETHSFYSESHILTANYDIFVWLMLFASIFITVHALITLFKRTSGKSTQRFFTKI